MISDNYTYPELPPHFQTAHMRILIQDAHMYGLSPADVAELMRITEGPITEILRGYNSTLLQKSSLSSKEWRKLCVAKWALLEGIRDARNSISRRFRDDEVEFVEDYAPIERQSRKGISSPPGTTLSSLADFFSSKKTRKLILTPIIADMQEEYFDALMADRIWKARWVRIRGCCAFWQSWGISGFLKTVGTVWRLLAR
jgi:hypothetical protein